MPFLKDVRVKHTFLGKILRDGVVLGIHQGGQLVAVEFPGEKPGLYTAGSLELDTSASHSETRLPMRVRLTLGGEVRWEGEFEDLVKVAESVGITVTLHSSHLSASGD